MAKRLSRKEFEEKVLKLEEQRVFVTGGKNHDPKKAKELKEEILIEMGPIIKRKRAKLDKIGLKITAKVTTDFVELTFTTKSGKKIQRFGTRASVWYASHSLFKKTKSFPGAVKEELFSTIASLFFKKSVFSSSRIFDFNEDFKHHSSRSLNAPWAFNDLITEAIIEGFAEDQFDAVKTKVKEVLGKKGDDFKSKRQKEIHQFGREKFYELVKKLCGSHYQFNADELHDMIDEYRTKDLLEK